MRYKVLIDIIQHIADYIINSSSTNVINDPKVCCDILSFDIDNKCYLFACRDTVKLNVFLDK